MQASDIIEAFQEAFTDNPSYYVILFLALVILILFLLNQPKHQKPATRQENQNIPRRPRYAAGSDIDNIRNMTPYRMRSDDNSHIFIFIGIILFIVAIPHLLTYLSRNQTQHDQIPVVSSDTEPAQNLKDVVMSMEPTFNADRTQLFITSTYTNRGATTVYSLVPSFKITDSEGALIAEREGEYIIAIPPSGQVEQTVRIEFEAPVAGVHIEQRIEYRKVH